MDNTIIRINGISKHFGKQQVLDKLTLDVEKNTMTSITGASGSGKTTLLNIIGTLEKADEGKVMVDGSDLTGFDRKAVCEYRNRMIGFVFQAFYLEPAFDVYRNIEVPLLIRNDKDKKDHKELITKILSEVGLESKIHAKVHELSGGEQQRVCIARALVGSPKILLCDEPCGNLDSANSRNIIRLLREQTRRDTTVIMVTHSREDAECSDRIVSLSDGRIVDDKDLR
ncbi:ABC transporter ATP-binding protein [Ruminococcus sp.]|uniref:ABC transporter ATP-binding protein n=1 Tax=Ruminococcus sp. TaxID=41978 RepID=UPI0025F0C2BB|nr:ABC transporter ATP-binding protein [Ruminococcus sp.]MBQ8965965.1 ABC transporter ATP-binding protein [Ruminococcus sp.]